MRRLLCTLAIFIPLSLMAAEVKTYEWEKDRTRYQLTDAEKQMSEYILKSHSQYDYVFENNQFIMYATLHRIIYVNSNEAIESNNRISIPMSSTFDLVDIKARAIGKDGRVVNFDKNNLKEIKDDKGDKGYRIFAIEGVEMGSEIEFYYVRKMESYLFERISLQTDVPIKSASFSLSCPKHLIFDFKSYFGLPDVKKKEEGDRNVFTVETQNVPALKKEEFSYMAANRKRVEFKIAYNTAKSNARLYTWDEAAKLFFNKINTLTKDEVKALDKFCKSLNDNPASETGLRIKNAEEKMKLAIQVDKNISGAQVKDIASITKYKVANNEGMTRLMNAVFNYLKIPVQIVLTCDREVAKFDPQFDTWGYLDEYFLYFPETKGFVAPYSFEARYPLIPHEFIATNGLFIEAITLGEIKSGLGSINPIPAPEYSVSSDNLDLTVNFSDDLTSTQINQIRTFTGYNGRYLSPYYATMSKEDKQRLIEELIKQTAPDAEIKTWNAEVVRKSIYDNFEMKVDFNSTHFIEKAGPKLLFKIGELIGAQTEMYQDNQRTTPVENDYNRLYDRIIKVKLPTGYTVKNLKDLNFNVVFNNKPENPYAFISKYSINGSELVINIHEYYKEITVPVNEYEPFRKVVNAAADFNKVTLVLEKAK